MSSFVSQAMQSDTFSVILHYYLFDVSKAATNAVRNHLKWGFIRGGFVLGSLAGGYVLGGFVRRGLCPTITRTLTLTLGGGAAHVQ